MVPKDSAGSPSWETVAAELRAYREQQRQTWGDLDHALIGKYLAGEVTADERRRVEVALDTHPELRLLTDVVSDVLNDCQAVEQPPAQIIPFTTTKRKRSSGFARFRQQFALAAAACLLLGLGFLLHKQIDPSNPTARNSGKAELFASRLSERQFLPGQRPPDEKMLVAQAEKLVKEKHLEEAADLLFAQRSKATAQMVAQADR